MVEDVRQFLIERDDGWEKETVQRTNVDHVGILKLKQSIQFESKNGLRYFHLTNNIKFIVSLFKDGILWY